MTIQNEFEKHTLATMLLRSYIDPRCGDKLVRGAFVIVAKRMEDVGWEKVKPRFVKHMWSKYNLSILYPEKYKHDVSRKEGSGGQRKVSIAELHRRVKEVHFSDRQTLHSLASKIDVPAATLH